MPNTYTYGPAIAADLPTLYRTIKDGSTYTADVATVADAGILYLLEYGWSQAIGDSQALGKDAIAALAKKAKVEVDDSPAFKGWLSGVLAERAKARVASIVDGTIEFGSLERLSPEEKERRAQTMAILVAWAFKNNKKLPKAADELKPLLDKVYAQKQAEIDKAVAKVMRERANAKVDDLVMDM